MTASYTQEAFYENTQSVIAAKDGWSQQDLADQLGLSKASIAKLEMGIMRLSPENKAALQKLIKETGVEWGFSAGTLTVAAGKNVIGKLDPKKALSLPTNN